MSKCSSSNDRQHFGCHEFLQPCFYVIYVLNIPAFLYMTTCRLAYKNQLFFLELAASLVGLVLVHEYRSENLKHLLSCPGDSFVIQDYSSLAFRGFENLRGRPKNKNTSLGILQCRRASKLFDRPNSFFSHTVFCSRR